MGKPQGTTVLRNGVREKENASFEKRERRGTRQRDTGRWCRLKLFMKGMLQSVEENCDTMGGDTYRILVETERGGGQMTTLSVKKGRSNSLALLNDL